jgi:hypothetical protein
VFISAELYDHTGTHKIATVPGVQFNQLSGRVTPIIIHKGLAYALSYGDTFANVDPLNPPIYRQTHTQNL